MQKISTCLWFASEAEEAMNYYTSIFRNSKVLAITRYGKAGPGQEGDVMVTSFELEGEPFMALNGGPGFGENNNSVSLVVDCKDQAEVDHYWDKLLEGGKPLACGWLHDKFGVAWQITPSILPKLLGDPDPERAHRAMVAMMKMVKFDIAELMREIDG